MENKYSESYEILKNSYENFFEGENNKPSFTFFEGSKKVIFSCPHAVNQTRKGKTKLADVNTGPLGLALNQLGYPVLIKTKNCNDDANYDLISDYKKYLKKIIKNKCYYFCVDLHGLSAKRDILFCLGTNFGKNLNKNIDFAKIFFDIAQKNNFPKDLISVDNPFHAPFRTVSNFVHRHSKISAIQIEINSRIFKSEEQTISLLKTLDEYATYIEKNLYKNNSEDLSL